MARLTLPKQSGVRKKIRTPVIPASVNVERDADSPNILAQYSPTSATGELLTGICQSIYSGGGAHSITGAYGSGKSMMALYASHLFTGASTQKVTSLASAHKPIIGNKIFKAIRDTKKIAKHIVPINVVAPGQKLKETVISKFREKAQQRGRKASIDPIQSSLRILARKGAEGIFLVIDEFGRSLEQAARSGEMADLHFIQDLAEVACRKNDIPLIIVIIHHFGIMHYARGLTSDQSIEWSKLKGRFRNTTVINSDMDNARIVARYLGKPVRNTSHLGQALDQCTPLHPATTLALGRLARQIAQDGRTITSWLSSLGYQQKKTDIMPDALFDDFILMGDGLDPIISRELASARNILGRYGNGPDVALLKTIAVLNLTGGGHEYLLSNEKNLTKLLGNSVRHKLKRIEDEKFIAYRAYRKEYRITHGSDYDLNERIANEIEQREISPAKALEDATSWRSVRAQRHYVKTGCPRVASIHFLDTPDALTKINPLPHHDACILVFLWQDDGSVYSLEKKLALYTYWADKNVIRLAQEAAAIQLLIRDDLNLKSDPVASEEARIRLQVCREALSAKISYLLGNDTCAIWIGSTKAFAQVSAQSALSEYFDQLFPDAPMLHNEMINTATCSPTVTRARKLLAHAMLEAPDKEALGMDIETWPPERSIYEKVLRTTGLHRHYAGQWQFTTSTTKLNESGANMAPTVSALIKLIENSEKEPINCLELLKTIQSPPYGVKPAVAPIILLSVLLAQQHLVAIYEVNDLVISITQTVLDRLLAKPERFSISSQIARGNAKVIVRGCAKALDVPSEKANMPEVTRALIKAYRNLDNCALAARDIPSNIKQFRDGLVGSGIPREVLCHVIPNTLFKNSRIANENIVAKQIKNALRVLTDTRTRIIKRQEKTLRRLCGTKNISETRKWLQHAACQLDTQHTQSQQATMLSVLKDPRIISLDNKNWLAAVIEKGYGGFRPIRDWSPNDEELAETSISQQIAWIRGIEAMNNNRGHAEQASQIAVVLIKPSAKPVVVNHGASNSNLVGKINDVLAGLPKEAAKIALAETLAHIEYTE